MGNSTNPVNLHSCLFVWLISLFCCSFYKTGLDQFPDWCRFFRFCCQSCLASWNWSFWNLYLHAWLSLVSVLFLISVKILDKISLVVYTNGNITFKLLVHYASFCIFYNQGTQRNNYAKIPKFVQKIQQVFFLAWVLHLCIFFYLTWLKKNWNAKKWCPFPKICWNLHSV